MYQPELVHADELTNVLQTAVRGQISAVMSHMSRGKWHMTKVTVKDMDASGLCLEIVAKEQPRPINVRIDQPVGISFKLGYNKFIGESTVIGLGPANGCFSGGTITVTLPSRMEKLQRRNFFRVRVPSGLQVRAMFWHRGYSNTSKEAPKDSYWQGRLVDISAGGLQILASQKQEPNFKAGQFIGLQFTPMPYEIPILLEGQVRHIAPTADGKHLALGVQIIGLEASDEGRAKLTRLCGVVEQYYQMGRTTKAGHHQPVAVHSGV